MSFYPAEHFQGSDDENMHNWQNYTYSQTSQPGTFPPLTEERHTLDVAKFPWQTPQHPYTGSQLPQWPSENRILDADTLQTPTQAMFSNATSALSTPIVASSWPSAPNTHASCTQAEAHLDNRYPTLSALIDHAQWRPFHQATTSQAYHNDAVATHGSPAQSDHSESSYSSLIASSPYAQSDGYFHTASPPAIKLEDPFDRSLYSVPGANVRDFTSHVDPNDIYTHALTAAAYQGPVRPSTAATHSAKGESPDVKHNESSIMAGPSTHSPFGTGVGTQDVSRKAEEEAHFRRGFTTIENFTCHCPQCGKLFQRSYNLKAHLETHDPNRAQPHTCGYPDCKRAFVRRTDLTRHETSVHLKARNFTCTMCSHAFTRKDTLRRHVEDGCPRRPEMKKRIQRRRSSATTTVDRRHGQSYAHGLPAFRIE